MGTKEIVEFRSHFLEFAKDRLFSAPLAPSQIGLALRNRACVLPAPGTSKCPFLRL